jgi:hypothetical protein
MNMAARILLFVSVITQVPLIQAALSWMPWRMRDQCPNMMSRRAPMMYRL